MELRLTSHKVLSTAIPNIVKYDLYKLTHTLYWYVYIVHTKYMRILNIHTFCILLVIYMQLEKKYSSKNLFQIYVRKNIFFAIYKYMTFHLIYTKIVFPTLVCKVLLFIVYYFGFPLKHWSIYYRSKNLNTSYQY